MQKITLVIDSLAAGGAQRQLCILALGLVERGYEVDMITYHPLNFFLSMIEGKVPVTTLASMPVYKRALAIRSALQVRRPDAVIAFLEATSLYCEFSRLTLPKFNLIVSERNYDTRYGLSFWIKLIAHTQADAIACNSYAQTDLIKSKAPWLKPKLSCIVNAIQLDKFSFRPVLENQKQNKLNVIRLLSLGRFVEQKNGLLLLHGLSVAKVRYKLTVNLDWFGNRFLKNGIPTARSRVYLEMIELSKSMGIDTQVVLESPVEKVEDIYPRYDAFILASRHEGCPNVLLEAMATGLLVIASRVADNEKIITHGVTGLLFDDDNPDSLADTLKIFSGMSHSERTDMIIRARATVETQYTEAVMVDKYVALLNQFTH
ncbi:MAG: glycosyltransferase [Pseudomonadota bacterium]|nr:glycosyltransferase [Pseudomonadota bacterium]MDP2351052.1 glycosyltransferase [Pseudomonadota bacterium]